MRLRAKIVLHAASGYPDKDSAGVLGTDRKGLGRWHPPLCRPPGSADRFHELPGSAFEVEFEKDYDVILFTNFLHYFGVPACDAF